MEIRIGLIINTHGIKGELKLNALTDDLERFKDLDYVYLEKTGKKHQVLGVKYIKDNPILKLEGIDSIDQAELYKNTYLSIDKEQLVDLPDGAYFIFDLIDCKVYDLNDNYIGVVKDVLTYAANDVYLIKTESKKEVMIPAIKEFVKDIDIDNKVIKIDPIEGMIEWK